MVDFPITINKITFKCSEIIPYIRKCQSQKAIEHIINKTNCSFDEAEEVVNDVKKAMFNNGYSTKCKVSTDVFKTCPQCKKEYMYLTDHCTSCGYSTQAYKNRMKKLEEDVEQPIIKKYYSQMSTLPANQH